MSIISPEPDSKTASRAPTLMGVYELMQDCATERADVFLDRVASLMYGIATNHDGMKGCHDCDDGDVPCVWVETATEVAFSWLMQEARR